MKIKHLLQEIKKYDIWNSPTLMTWLSYSSKTLSLFAVLPLILKYFSQGDVALWYLFFTIIMSASAISEFGFRQTFCRFISFAYAGSKDLGVAKKHPDESSETIERNMNLPLLNQVVFGMKNIYLWLTLFCFVLLGLFGTWSLLKPIKYASNANEAWICWIIILVVSCINFYGKIYANFLEGLFKVALVRRVETLTAIAAAFTSLLIMVISPSLLNLVIVNQFWALLNTIRDYYLCIKTENGLYKSTARKTIIDKSFLKKLWTPTWRNGIAGIINTSVCNLSGLFVAQVADTAAVASYLLALRILNQIKDISMAPFYSKLSLFAILRVQNNIDVLKKVVQRGMFLSHLSYMIAFLIVGLFSKLLLELVHSKVHFVDSKMWLLMGLAFFVQRYSAMHMQIYTSTNHVLVHIAEFISGIIFLIFTLVIFPYIGIYAIPIGMFLGYSLFYSWYSVILSYRSLGIALGSMEFKILWVPSLLLIVYIFFTICLPYINI